jgi:hypothetical protein
LQETVDARHRVESGVFAATASDSEGTDGGEAARYPLATVDG